MDSLLPDNGLLELLPESLEPLAPVGNDADNPFEQWASLVPEAHLDLAEVATRCAHLTIPISRIPRPAHTAYWLFLVAGWIWDDLVDINVEGANLDGLLDSGLRAIQAAVQKATNNQFWKPGAERYDSALPSSDPRWDHIATVRELLQDSATLIQLDLANYAPRIFPEMQVFFESFRDKAQLRSQTPNISRYLDVRRRCSGIKLCLEFGFGINAHASGVQPSEFLSYLHDPSVEQCIRQANLHAAAANDLFSLYKDRQLEGIPGFPSLFASDQSIQGYLEGSHRTLEYLKERTREFRKAVQRLPKPSAFRAIVEETCIDMMKGNVAFHLSVKRYSEGVELVRCLTDPRLGRSEQLSRFRSSMPPPAMRPLSTRCG